MLVLLTYPLSSVFFPDITILLTSVRRGGGCPPASGKMYLRKGRKHHVGRGNTEVKGGSSAPWEGRFSLWRGGDLHLSMFMLLLSPAIFLMRKYHTWANLKYFTTHMFHDFQSLERTRILRHLKVKYCKEWVMKSLTILSTQRKKKKKKGNEMVVLVVMQSFQLYGGAGWSSRKLVPFWKFQTCWGCVHTTDTVSSGWILLGESAINALYTKSTE